jgi:hypothetical protein
MPSAGRGRDHGNGRNHQSQEKTVIAVVNFTAGLQYLEKQLESRKLENEKILGEEGRKFALFMEQFDVDMAKIHSVLHASVGM